MPRVEHRVTGVVPRNVSSSVLNDSRVNRVVTGSSNSSCYPIESPLTAADALRGGDGDVALARARGPPHLALAVVPHAVGAAHRRVHL